ncbi:MAG: gliding motility-associated C-terminal domain-containing protein [Saprospiraceae bacterium]|nr:gliding motility-associated C-terminal domain-containing protein [Saprospiraceae bacterium]
MPPLPVVTATDNCDLQVTVTLEEEEIEGTCEGAYILIRRWTATDNCGNTATGEQRITVGDGTPPVLVGVPASVTVECDDIPDPATVTAEDDCDDDVEVMYSDQIIPGQCADAYSIIRTWTAEDDCGNVATATQSITVIDTTPPVLIPMHPDLTGVMDGDTLVIDCKLTDVFDVNDFKAEDNCDEDVTITFHEVKTDGDCLQDGYYVMLECTWMASDDCGNTNSFTIYMLLTDTVPPVFVQAPDDLTLECDQTVPSAGPVVLIDNCDDEIQLSLDEIIVPGACPQEYTITRTWTATDDCGNVSTHTQTITVQDSNAPVITGVPSDVTVNIANGESVPEIPMDVTAEDNCDSNVSFTFEEEIISGQCEYVIIRTWTAEDDCGNVTIQSQKITVLDGLEVDLNIIHQTCDSLGSIEANVVAGTPPFQFHWEDPSVPSTQNVRTGLEAGTYSLTVVDASGCQRVFDPIILENECECILPVVDTVLLVSPTCKGGKGSIEIILEQNPDLYQFHWTPSVSTTHLATELMAGTYEVRIVDKNDPDCFIKIQINLEGPEVPEVTVEEIKDETCKGNDGYARLAPPDLVYLWSDNGTGAVRTNLKAGTYSVTATDPSTGCFTILPIVIGGQDSLVVTAEIHKHPDCLNNNGHVTIHVTGGSGQYTYSWGPGATRTDLSAGMYTVLVQDTVSGCTGFVTFFLDNQTEGVDIEADTILLLACHDSHDGYLDYQLVPSPGFLAPASVQIRDANGTVVENGELTPGTYCLVVFDGHGCLAGTHCFEVVAPDKLEAQILVRDADCDTLGQITLNVSGGTSPYTFDWAHIAGTNDPGILLDLEPGSYAVTVTDLNGCTIAFSDIKVLDMCHPCPPSLDSLTAIITDCDEPAEVCLEIPLTQYHEYTILWNGEPYDGLIDGCQFDSIIAYTYYTLLGLGYAGPYELTSWTVNGQQFQGLFQNVEDLVDSMNVWDPTGNWVQFPTQLLIVGGDYSNTYSKMLIKQLAFPNSYAEIGFNYGVVSTETKIFLPEGTHEIVIYEPGEICGDTLIVTVECHPDSICPVTDTIHVQVYTEGSVTACAHLEYCMSDSTSLYEGCAGGLSGTSTLGEWQLDAHTGCMTFVAGTLPGIDVLCVVACDQANGLCDTTYIVVECLPKPGCPTVDTLYASIDVNQPVVVCAELESCMDAASTTYQSCEGGLSGSTTLGNWTLDGVTGCLNYTAGPDPGQDVLCVVACDSLIGLCDTTWMIILIKPDCPPILSENQAVVNIQDCDGEATYCLDIPLNQVGNYTFTLEGEPFTGIVDGCDFDSLYGYNYSLIPGGGNAGPYSLDEWMVDGVPYSGQFQNLAELTALMNGFDVDGNWFIDAGIVNIVGGDKVSSYGPLRITQTNTFIKATINLNDLLIPNGTLIAVDTGHHTLVITEIATGCTDTLWLTVQCGECPEVYSGPDSLVIDDCFGTASICLDIPAEEFDGYEVWLNDTAYAGITTPCDSDSLWRYSYAGLHAKDPDGPYQISWMINGQIQTATVSSVEDMVDTMNAWDPQGHWAVDTILLVIQGGHSEGQYGSLSIGFPNVPGVPVVTWLAQPWVISNGTALTLPVGSHSIRLINTVNGCTYLYELTVNCEDGNGVPDTLHTEILVGFTDTLCLPTGLSGVIVSAENLCPEASGWHADIALAGDSTCLIITGEAIGTDTACMVFCDDHGQCDTVILVVHVVPPTIDTVVYVLETGQDTTHCLSLAELSGNPLNVTDLCPESNGAASIGMVDSMWCLEITGLTEGSDTACLVICDAITCDTTIVVVHVIPAGMGGDPPIAVNDSAKVLENRPLNINVLLNDTLNGVLTGSGVLVPPANGTITVIAPGIYRYLPLTGFCGAIDSFTYYIANASGADTAVVYVEVVCRKIVVYTGFSPNGDLVNDKFHIDGIDDYPNNEVTIFNRWGNQVFRMKGYSNDKGWDGRWQGNDVPDGTYFYVITSGEGETYTGYVQIQR